MRCRLAALMLFLTLPLLNLLAAPVPDPSAILDIGPPRKGIKADEHCKETIRYLKDTRGYLLQVGHYAEATKLPSVAGLKDIPSWLAKNLQVKEEDGGRRLRLTFRAGTRAEQVNILNTLLRFYRNGVARGIKSNEGALRPLEKHADLLDKGAKEEKDPMKRAQVQKVAEDTRKIGAPIRDEIARLKQISVIKWAE